MEVEIEPNGDNQKNTNDHFNEDLGARVPASDLQNFNQRTKTSLRMHYHAQVNVIQKQYGSLENIRFRLGLSARKMCQLLLVDPSSWSRWVNKGDECPPHIWRALQWYLIVNEKYPSVDERYFLGKDVKFLGVEIKDEMNRYQSNVDRGTHNWSVEANKKIQDLQFRLDQSSERENRVVQELKELKQNQQSFVKRQNLMLSALFFILISLVLFILQRHW